MVRPWSATGARGHREGREATGKSSTGVAKKGIIWGQSIARGDGDGRRCEKRRVKQESWARGKNEKGTEKQKKHPNVRNGGGKVGRTGVGAFAA